MNAYEDFISTVSHELRTPLTSIRGFAQTMLNSYDKLDDESKKKFLKIIETQANRLINLTENMLSVSKFQNDENFIFKSISAKPLIESVIQIVKQQYQNKEFELNFNPKVPNILADSEKFQQILLNLIENAAKYSDDNTKIKIKVDFSKEPDYISIKVEDKGIKIEEKDYENIFTKFSRLDNPLTRKVQGTGLGLYITKLLTEKMNGKISVKSSDESTIFEVLMPSENIEKQARNKCLHTH